MSYINPYSTITDPAIILDMIKANVEALSDPIAAANLQAQGSIQKRTPDEIRRNLSDLQDRLNEINGIKKSKGRTGRRPVIWAVSHRGDY